MSVQHAPKTAVGVVVRITEHDAFVRFWGTDGKYHTHRFTRISRREAIGFACITVPARTKVGAKVHMTREVAGPSGGYHFIVNKVVQP